MASHEPGREADVVIVGAGVIGTAIGWQAASRGLSVTVVDPGWGDAATDVAAGMLAPALESVFGETDLLALNLLAVDRFPGFAAELERATGLSVGLRTEGTLAVAFDRADHDRLKRLTAFRREAGLRAQELDARACREAEPFLAPGVHGGVLAIGDLSVDNRRYAAALRAAAAQAGVSFLPGRATRVVMRAEGGYGVHLSTGAVGGPAAPGGPGDEPGQGHEGAEGHRVPGRKVVLAAGWRTGRIGGIPGYLAAAFRPVKGQILRLRHPEGMPPILTHTIRAIVRGADVYLVPRADGEVVVGATQDERDDLDVTAGAVHDLLRDAMSVLPAVSELNLAEARAGLRPGSADNGPVVGWAEQASLAAPGLPEPGLIVAAGHFRNGIMLSAATADAVTSLLTGGQPAAEWKPFTPERLRAPGQTPPGPHRPGKTTHQGS
ncbi:MAG TPA: FAD-dependent oxidoreductase [Trebonia sp.]|nr:FAD-dependent oxidoreductase [Trebonia sp.]